MGSLRKNGLEKIFTTALHDEQGRYDFNNPKLEAKETKDGDYVINGTRILVPYAHVADAILVLAEARGSSAGGPTILKVDTKADVKDFGDIFSYVSEKTDDLLDSGVEKVLWILTESQKILIAEQGKQWLIAKWNDTIPVLEDITINLEELINTLASDIEVS